MSERHDDIRPAAAKRAFKLIEGKGEGSGYNTPGSSKDIATEALIDVNEAYKPAQRQDLNIAKLLEGTLNVLQVSAMEGYTPEAYARALLDGSPSSSSEAFKNYISKVIESLDMFSKTFSFYSNNTKNADEFITQVCPSPLWADEVLSKKLFTAIKHAQELAAKRAKQDNLTPEEFIEEIQTQLSLQAGGGHGYGNVIDFGR